LASACAWSDAAFKSLTSPCLPFCCPSISPCSDTCPTQPSSPLVITHLPLGETKLALAPSLGSDALVFLQRAAHDARCDGDVTVVAVQNCQLRLLGAVKASATYVRPAAFHANAIVMVVYDLVGRDGFAGCGWALERLLELRRDFAHAGALTSRDENIHLSHSA
jgi:hypothetical protein